jgi:hypothetical protein
MCLFISCCTQEMLSTPPATKTSAFAGNDALRGQGDGLQARRAEAVDGHARHGDRQPGAQAIWRAMLAPVAPSGLAQPMMTSSTSPASMPAR